MNKTSSEMLIDFARHRCEELEAVVEGQREIIATQARTIATLTKACKDAIRSMGGVPNEND